MLQLSRAKPGNPASIYIQESVCVCVCVSFQAYTRRRLWSDRDQIWHTHADSPRKGSLGKIKICPVSPRGEFGGFQGVRNRKCGKSAKWLDRLAPNLAHMCGFIWEWTQVKNSQLFETQGGNLGVLRGQKYKSQENLQSGCTDWQQICYTSAYSSGNGHRLKTISSSRPKGGTWGVQGGKSQENLPSGCTDWHQICYTSADSSGNGHMLKTISPSIFQGAFLGVLGVTKCKSLENLPNGWTDWHQIWYTSADSYGNGHRLKTNSPSRPGGHFGVQVVKM